MIDEEIMVTVMEISGNLVRLGFAAPDGVSIYREEIWQAVKEENRAASGVERLSCRPATRATRPDLACAVLVRISLRRRRRFTDSDAGSRLEAL